MTEVERFLSKNEQEQIKQSVHRAEQQTTGEIVPLIVAASHPYPAAILLGGTALAFLAAIMCTLAIGQVLWQERNLLWIFLGLFFFLYPLGAFLVQRFPAIKRLFIADNQKEMEVQRGALTTFYEENLHHTKDANGVLIYISVLERKVWILGDRQVNQKVESGTWQEIVDELTWGIQQKEQGKSICKAVDRIALILKRHFPIQADDSNELQDLIIKSHVSGSFTSLKKN